MEGFVVGRPFETLFFSHSLKVQSEFSFPIYDVIFIREINLKNKVYSPLREKRKPL